MRTYSRKVPPIQVLDNIERLCRLCLKDTELDGPVPIFSQDQGCVHSLALRIMMCVGLEVTKEDTYPKLLCTQCHQELERCYTFRKKCHMSYQKLKSHSMINHKMIKIDQNKDVESKVAETNGSMKHNLFEVNFDGSISLNQGLDTSRQEPLVTLGIIKEGSLQANVACATTSSNVEYSIPMDINKMEEQPIVENCIEPAPETADISELLTDMLIEMGILIRHGNQLAVVNQETRMVELVMNSGEAVMLELMEEQEQVQAGAVSTNVDVNEEKKIIIEGHHEAQCLAGSKDTQGELVQSRIQPDDATVSRTERISCRVCSREYASHGAMSRHAREVHDGVKKYKCAVCHAKFAQKVVLKRHEFVHREVRPHACSQCPKSFTQRSALQTHERSHAPPHARVLALHRCVLCPKVFLYASGLSRHIRLHTGRPFRCDRCKRAFHDSSSLRRHQALAKCKPPNNT